MLPLWAFFVSHETSVVCRLIEVASFAVFGRTNRQTELNNFQKTGKLERII